MDNVNVSDHTPAQSSPFDALADHYDELFEASPITRWLRERVYAEIQRRIPPASFILDIACGTGTDALELVRRGYRVLGVDSSVGMIDIAIRKAASKDGVQFRQGSFENLAETVHGPFDVVLSNFGGLNCTQQLRSVCRDIAQLTRSGGYFVGVIMPPFALWELLYAFRHLDPSYAIRRLGIDGRTISIGEKDVRVHYHSTWSGQQALKKWFLIEKVAGFNIVVPPPPLKRFVSRYPGLVRTLIQIEARVERLPLLRSLGDHYIIVGRRR
jgi:ubiquinone/menaquinone biosynthesis C-methylase UbiE